MPITMPVAKRIALLQQIFSEFGIPVAKDSALDLAIRNEFGPGKRSKLNQILQNYTQHTDAAVLSACIGAELQSEFADPGLAQLGKVMSERLPSLLEIFDINAQTAKREQLLAQILTHFKTKLPPSQASDRLIRMLIAAENQLHAHLQTQAVGIVVADLGNVFACQDLQRCGTALRAILPVLISLEEPSCDTTQRVNLATQALRTLGNELHCVRLEKAANIIDYVHWLAQVNLPSLSETVTVEDILQKLDSSFGATTARMLRDKNRAVGLHDQELLEILASNQKHAATCSIIAKFGQELAIPELEKIGAVGLCTLTMRQAFYELKAGSVNAVNLSESLGILLSGIGTVSNNKMLSKLGNAVSNGVKAYAGLMAVPGGVTVALPLAVCTALAGILIKHKPKPGNNINKVVQQSVADLQQIQHAMRWHFAELHNTMTIRHRELISMVDQGFNGLTQLIGQSQLLYAQTWRQLESINDTISNEFVDLYLEYIRDPLDQLKYYENYDQFDQAAAPQIKLKLNMWLLYKAKHPKVNGGLQNPEALQSTRQPAEAKLGLINRFLNQEFDQHLPEDLPHLPTWLLTIDAYMDLLPRYQDQHESRILQDLLKIGSDIHGYLENLKNNAALWQQIATALAELDREERQILSGLAPPVPVTDLLKLAKPAAWELQFERFTALSWDLTAIWDQYQLAVEYGLAQHYRLGNVYAQYIIERTNTFTEFHVPSNNDPLPNDAGKIKFKIEIYFKGNDQDQPQLLATSQHQYILASAQERFTQYYQQKFHNFLRHNNYLWIGIDGKQNQVDGYPVTNTNKPIDYTRLGQVYGGWFRNSVLQNVQRLNNDELISQLSVKIASCQAREQQACAAAQLAHTRLGEVRRKLGLYKALEAAMRRLTAGPLAGQLEYTVARLRLLLPSCRDIIPNL